jgi:hypothetical protein
MRIIECKTGNIVLSSMACKVPGERRMKAEHLPRLVGEFSNDSFPGCLCKYF